jgi:predicted class III extradiol MEMO1 family dioxygenase
MILISVNFNMCGNIHIAIKVIHIHCMAPNVNLLRYANYISNL